MRDIEITADDNRFFRTQIKEERAKGILPVHAVIEAFERALCIRRVDSNEVDIRQLHRNDAPLVVVLLYTDAIGHREGLYARKDRRTRIPLFLCAVKILLIAGQIEDRLSLLHLGLLQAEYIGIQLLERFHEALLERGAQSVDVP